MADRTQAKDKGVIGRVKVDGLPVIYKLVDEAPPDRICERYPWLTVIGWQYDGDGNNGMPVSADANRMTALEQRLDTLVDRGHCVHAYSRTGAGIKEFVYYISDRDSFAGGLNEVLRNDPRYPISIEFYKDETWEDFGKVRAMFKDFPRPSD